MDFELIEEQRILQKTAQDFLKKECPKELVRSLDESEDGHSPELWKKMAELGWQGLIYPEEYGGYGGQFIDLVIIQEEMGKMVFPSPFFSTVIQCGLVIMEGGTEDFFITHGNFLLAIVFNKTRYANVAPKNIAITSFKSKVPL